MTSLPTSSADKNWPKGPNFLGIVIAFAVAILLILGVAVYLVRGRAQKAMPVDTRSTPSQTRVCPPDRGTTSGPLSGARINA